ncbi:MAG: ATP-binding protein, partial [Oscillospiraceae bacterium]|nr:ATP-binding protein [Oscillospiraceae bacterium]
YKRRVVLCFREVEEEKQHQLQERKLLENALESSRQSEKTKQAFFSNMSHDMRTPLNAIIGLTELARQNTEDPQRTDGYLEKIAVSSRQLLELINDILDMSRMEQGKVVLDYRQFDLKESIRECAEPFRLQAEKEGKQFQLSFDMSDPVVLGDPFRISQIMNNLLSNGLKFTGQGDSITVSVTQFQEETHAKYQIVVKDTGIGMSEEFLPQIFEPYARETRFTARKITGTGLGMPIVKNLVTQMSGQIQVESHLGEGTTFTLVLPLEAVRSQEVEMAENQEADQQSAPPAALGLTGRRILLAEDNEVNMEIATEILSGAGLEVTQAWNGQEAVEHFAASQPFFFDAVLMDMQMPQMDGCTAAKQIRRMSRPDAEKVPIIAVTANAFAEDIAATTAAGMNAHVSKPIDFPALLRKLEELTKRPEDGAASKENH